MGGMECGRGARAALRRARRLEMPQRWGIVAAAYIGCVIIFWTFDMVPRNFAGCGADSEGRRSRQPRRTRRPQMDSEVTVGPPAPFSRRRINE